MEFVGLWSDTGTSRRIWARKGPIFNPKYFWPVGFLKSVMKPNIFGPWHPGQTASIWEKAISILSGNFNSGRSYLITAVSKSWKRGSLILSEKSRISFHCSNTIKNCKTTGYHKRLSGQVWKEKKEKDFWKWFLQFDIFLAGFWCCTNK